MPRSLRLDFPGAVHHLIARGNNREALFRGTADYRAYLDMLFEKANLFGLQIHAYCLMPNHVHLLVRSVEGNIAELVERLHGWYARRFNQKYSRVGHAFQRRYRSKIVADNAYLLEVSRYIHMNPVVSKIASKPHEYRWSSFRSHLLGRARPPMNDLILTSFSGARGVNRKAFYDFTIARADFGCSPDDWLGDEDTYLDSLPTLYEDSAPDSERDEAKRVAPQTILKEVARAFHCSEDRLRNGWKDPRIVGARAAAMLLLREGTTLSLKEIGREMNVKYEQSVSRAISLARERVAGDSALRSLSRRLIIPPRSQEGSAHV